VEKGMNEAGEDTQAADVLVMAKNFAH